MVSRPAIFFDDIDGFSYDALLVPGGRAPEYLRLNERVLNLIRHFASERKPIAAVCHGAQLLAAAGVIKGRRVSGYPACAPEVNLAEGHFCDLAMDDAVTDGNLVTAPAWPAHPKWLAQFTRVLEGAQARAANTGRLDRRTKKRASEQER